MSGASTAHNRIAMSLARILGDQLRHGSCEPFGSDHRVATSPEGLYAYPDMTVVCGEVEYVDDQFDTLTNPVVIFEILSPSTEHRDRVEKAKAYWTMKTLRLYVLVSQDKPQVEVIERKSEQMWQTVSYTGLDSVAVLPGLDVRLELSELYERVVLPDSNELRS